MTNEEKQLKNEVKGYIAKSGWTLTDIVKKMNERLPQDKQTTVQNISNKLSRGSIKYVELKEIAEIIGYKLEWTKKEERKVPEHEKDATS
jgi:hypothetical protein